MIDYDKYKNALQHMVAQFGNYRTEHQPILIPEEGFEYVLCSP